MRQTVLPGVKGARNMHELEMKQFNPNYPSVNCSARLNVRIVQHALDITGIDFHLEILDAYNVELVGLKSTPKTINLNFSLRIT